MIVLGPASFHVRCRRVPHNPYRGIVPPVAIGRTGSVRGNPHRTRWRLLSIGVLVGSRVLQYYALVYVVQLMIAVILQRLPILFRIFGLVAFALAAGSALDYRFYSGSITTLSEPTGSVAGVSRLGGVRLFPNTANDIKDILSTLAQAESEQLCRSHKHLLSPS
jgi:hypothetical protein